MPGKKGVKLIPRLSTSTKFHSVRELVFSIFEKNPTATKEEVEKIVKKEYPQANFFGENGKGGHYTWYKHKWNKMKLEKEFKLAKPKSGGDHESVSHESKENTDTGIGGVEEQSVETVDNRKKNRRVPVLKNKRKVVVKTRKRVLQHRGNKESTEQLQKA